MTEATLLQAVETQARARIAQEQAVFASFCTPQALMQMRALPPLRAKRFEILALVASGATGSSDVLYGGRGAHILGQRWQLVDGVWTVVDVHLLPAPGGSVWQRLVSIFSRGDRDAVQSDGDVDQAA